MRCSPGWSWSARAPIKSTCMFGSQAIVSNFWQYFRSGRAPGRGEDRDCGTLRSERAVVAFFGIKPSNSTPFLSVKIQCGAAALYDGDYWTATAEACSDGEEFCQLAGSWHAHPSRWTTRTCPTAGHMIGGSCNFSVSPATGAFHAYAKGSARPPCLISTAHECRQPWGLRLSTALQRMITVLALAQGTFASQKLARGTRIYPTCYCWQAHLWTGCSRR